MAYDEKLADMIRRAVGPRDDVTEKKMFGGVAFLLDGKIGLPWRTGSSRHHSTWQRCR
jgi:hypothetical protein